VAQKSSKPAPPTYGNRYVRRSSALQRHSRRHVCAGSPRSSPTTRKTRRDWTAPTWRRTTRTATARHAQRWAAGAKTPAPRKPRCARLRRSLPSHPRSWLNAPCPLQPTSDRRRWSTRPAASWRSQRPRSSNCLRLTFWEAMYTQISIKQIFLFNKNTYSCVKFRVFFSLIR